VVKSEQLAHFAVPTKKAQQLLKPHSASAPNSPRVPRRAPLPITVTSSATLKVTNGGSSASSPSRQPRGASTGQGPGRSLSQNRPTTLHPTQTSSTSSVRNRSKSPNPRSATGATLTPGSHVSRSGGGGGGGSSSGAQRPVSRSPARPPPTVTVSSKGKGENQPDEDMATRRVKKNSLLNRSMSCDPNLDDPAVQAKIGGRLTKTINKTIGKCEICNKTVTDEGCTAFGKVYHKECFKCCKCRQKIQGKFFERGGKPYCPKCYAKLQDACVICKNLIKGDCVELAGKTYHPECCKCQICGETVRGKYFVHDGLPICEKDFKSRAQRCSVCKEVIVGAFFNIGDKILCEEHYKANAETCPRCHDLVSGSEIVRITGGCFHPGCFTCVECGKKMAHEPFITDSKMNIYCEEDYNLKKALRCAYCKKPIVPKANEKTVPRLRALGKDFHPTCFKCEDCGMLLDSKTKGKECYPWRNTQYCLRCNRKKFSSDEESSGDDD